MQFTEQKIVVAARNVAGVIAAVFLCVNSAFALQQLDEKFTDALGLSEAGNDTSVNRAALNVNLNYFGTFKVSPHGVVELTNVYEGFKPLYNDSLAALYENTVEAPFQERTIGSYNNASFGLICSALGTAAVRGRSYWLFNALDIPAKRFEIHDSMGNYLSGNTMKRRMVTQLDGEWTIPIRAVALDAGANFLTRHYDLIPEEGIDTSAKTVFTHESDLYTKAGAQVTTPIDITFSGDAWLKRNFGGYVIENISRYEVAAQGIHSFPLTNKVSWTLAGRWYDMNQPLRLAGEDSSRFRYMVHPYTRFMVRDVYTLGWGFFLKGTTMIDIGKSYFKDRYEVSLRKVWQRETSFDRGYFAPEFRSQIPDSAIVQCESSLEGGYFAALRGLVPTQGCYFRAVLQPVDRLMFATTLKSRWEYQERFADTLMMSTVGKFNNTLLSCNLEGAFSIIRDFEIMLGMNVNHYRYYENTYYDADAVGIRKDYPNRLDGYLGLRWCLR